MSDLELTGDEAWKLRCVLVDFLRKRSNVQLYALYVGGFGEAFGILIHTALAERLSLDPVELERRLEPVTAALREAACAPLPAAVDGESR